MIFDILRRFSFLISSYKIIDYDYFATNYKVVIEVHLQNGSELYVKDYLFSDGKRKYSFHWQDSAGECIIRWDNTPHHQYVKTFPYHKHIGKEESVEESVVMNLERVFTYINDHIQ
jgi:hypothetical protein